MLLQAKETGDPEFIKKEIDIALDANIKYEMLLLDPLPGSQSNG